MSGEKVTAIQDRAPPSGYGPIDYRKHMPKRGPSGAVMLGLGVGAMVIGFYLVGKMNRRLNTEKMEKRESRLSLIPYLQAENDLAYLQGQSAIDEREKSALGSVESPFNTDNDRIFTPKTKDSLARPLQ